MMEDYKLIASYGAGLEEKGKKTIQSLELKAVPGESIFLYGNPGRRQVHFEVLAGQRQLDSGDIILNGDSIYECPDVPSFDANKSFWKDFRNSVLSGKCSRCAGFVEI